ncbi:hypothetical protein H2248_012367 [Termitomyces sp. 'cryptogamus']|nr:hypothetical protein H2248_012367 [Termitomyces sp. 'cryptogamus']
MGDANDEQDNEAVEVKGKHVDESDGTQAKDDEDSEGLFALTEVPTTEGRAQDVGALVVTINLDLNVMYVSLTSLSPLTSY